MDKKNIITLAVGLIIGIGLVVLGIKLAPRVFGSATNFTDAVSSSNAFVASSTAMTYASIDLGSGIQSAAWCNNIKDSYGNATTTTLELATENFLGTASGTFRVFIGTTTAQAIAINPYLNPGAFGSLTASTSILMTEIATSTILTGTTTASLSRYNIQAGVISIPAMTSATTTCVVAGIVQGGENLTPSGGCDSAGKSTCESATSTARGFTSRIQLKMSYPYYNMPGY